jgi:hypothetical protein
MDQKSPIEHQREARRQTREPEAQAASPRGWRTRWACGPLVHRTDLVPPLYIHNYPKNIISEPEETFPPPQAFVLLQSHPEPISDTLSEGGSTLEGLYINLPALPMMGE